MDLHPQDYDDLVHGQSMVEQWRRSDHAVAVAAELMKLHGGTVPMSELLWAGAEAFLPRQWNAGRAAEPADAAAEVYDRWRRLTDRRLQRQRQAEAARAEQARQEQADGNKS
ncbi:hypothetical protein ACWT_5597 [Actinoplanes sp. SE50]|uniref:hypothetical protein n=1 Tax=unclassified Actinoplanes TaxID=2626549 RepID=UPI00023ECF1C|nr:MULTISPECIES: hypothetical protein [unclassified Actinoplanes]AEV86614.1 hypothetical protein ACPL_5727 [Actinoplanes sp. SE50/110]ATO85012.1 hypothetical protein ACWT_5597 [Actinoplanes sp. SE50]SLM02421.1 hypothetical protein ACSP50_5670 [Actinoplanes sp. SE50/110]